MLSDDPLSRASRVRQRLVIATGSATATTALIAWGLAPVHSSRWQDWPPIVWSSVAYAGKWLLFLIQNPSWQAFQQIDLLPFAHGLMIILGGVVTAVLLAATVAQAAKRSDYGDAHYADFGDVRRMGLNGKLGPVLGKFGGKLLKPAAPRSTLVLAPTRAGKTRGLVIPTILHYPGSMIVIDPKTELLQLTAEAQRAAGRRVVVIQWTNPESPNGWNPLGDDLPKDETALERALERQAAMLFPKADGAAGDGAYWADNGRRNFTALALFEVYEARRQGRSAKLGEMAAKLGTFEQRPDDAPGDPFGDVLKSLAREAMIHGYPERVSGDLLWLANIHPKERSSHLNTLMTGLQLWRSKAVAAVTGKTDFTWPDLRRKATTVYITFPQSDAKAYGPLTAIFLESLFAWALDAPAGKGEKSILVVGEEFASLPKIPLLFEALSKGNGGGLHLQVILQDLAQFKELYHQTGVDQLITNCTYLMAYSQANKYTMDILTALVGKTTRERKSRSRNGDRLFGSVNVSLEGVPLIRPEQWGQIPFGHHVLLAQNHFGTPMFCKSPFWDKDRHMRRLMARGKRG